MPGVAAAPLAWLGVGPLLVYNLVFLSGFILSGVGVGFVAKEGAKSTSMIPQPWTQRPMAPVSSGWNLQPTH